MEIKSSELKTNSLTWLKQDVFPLWSSEGIDAKNGGFIEALSKDGKAIHSARRALVQARQIYSFVTAAKLQVFDELLARQKVIAAAQFFDFYLLPSGACLHSVGPDGQPENQDLDLYTQAFALFALANVFEISRDESVKKKALRLLDFLNRERKAVGGGYTEIKNGTIMYQSNPHMHLFEASLYWLMVDSENAVWKTLANELFDLCKNKFIDKQTGALCEHFNEGWLPERTDGRFIFEPGHHYEWSWLLAVYEELTSTPCRELRHSLYSLADKYGLNKSHLAVDEVWSDFTIKKASSRFWPQCERIKAAVKLGAEMPAGQRASFAKSADQALLALNEYFQLDHPGLWQDTRLENGKFTEQAPKASSLYHIINAISEYCLLRPRLD